MTIGVQNYEYPDHVLGENRKTEKSSNVYEMWKFYGFHLVFIVLSVCYYSGFIIGGVFKSTFCINWNVKPTYQ